MSTKEPFIRKAWGLTIEVSGSSIYLRGSIAMLTPEQAYAVAQDLLDARDKALENKRSLT